MTYVWSHSLISSCIVEIGKRTGDSFAISIVGENEDKERFEISTIIQFTGINVYFSGIDTVESVESRLAESFDISNLNHSPFKSTGSKYNAGHVVFSPRENTT